MSKNYLGTSDSLKIKNNKTANCLFIYYCSLNNTTFRFYIKYVNELYSLFIQKMSIYFSKEEFQSRQNVIYKLFVLSSFLLGL